jgi:hypothetical protein
MTKTSQIRTRGHPETTNTKTVQIPWPSAANDAFGYHRQGD